MQSFKITETCSFTCLDPESTFIFYPKENNKFHWFGPKLDKLGKYCFVERDKLYLELEWNYSREQTYVVTAVENAGNGILGFVLKDNITNNLYKFSK